MTKLKERANHFWREVDRQDYVLLISVSSFFLYITVGLIMILLGRGLDPMYIELISMTTPIIVSVVAGVFSITAVSTFKGEKKEFTSNHTPTSSPSMTLNADHSEFNQQYQGYDDNTNQDSNFEGRL